MDKGQQVAFGHLNDIKTNPILAEILAEHTKQRKKCEEAAVMRKRVSVDMSNLKKAVSNMQFERRAKSTYTSSDKLVKKVGALGRSKT